MFKNTSKKIAVLGLAATMCGTQGLIANAQRDSQNKLTISQPGEQSIIDTQAQNRYLLYYLRDRLTYRGIISELNAYSDISIRELLEWSSEELANLYVRLLRETNIPKLRAPYEGF